MAKRKIEEINLELEAPKKTAIVKVFSNFRRGADMDSDVISTIEKGTEVTLEEENPIDGFYKVSCNNVVGYIRHDLLKIN